MHNLAQMLVTKLGAWRWSHHHQRWPPAVAASRFVRGGGWLRLADQLVCRDLEALHQQCPLADGVVVRVSYGMDGRSIELANGEQRSTLQLSCIVNHIGGWVPEDAFSDNPAILVGYAVTKEDGWLSPRDHSPGAGFASTALRQLLAGGGQRHQWLGDTPAARRHNVNWRGSACTGCSVWIPSPPACLAGQCLTFRHVSWH